MFKKYKAFLPWLKAELKKNRYSACFRLVKKDIFIYLLTTKAGGVVNGRQMNHLGLGSYLTFQWTSLGVWDLKQKGQKALYTCIFELSLSLVSLHSAFRFCSKLFFLFWYLSVYLLKLSGMWGLINIPYSRGTLYVFYFYMHTQLKPFVADVSHRGKPSQDVQPSLQTSWSAGNAKLVIKL